MKVEVNEIEDENRAIKYPYLGVYSDGEVVLFTGEHTGFAVSDHCDRVGFYMEQWAEQRATPFKGSITLSND